VLKVSDVIYQYPAEKEHYRYDMEVKPSEVVAILGPSGSGKSTLLDIIAGFLKPRSGSVTLDGRELLTLSVEKRPMSILFQNHNLFEHLSVEKNILLGVSKTLKDSIQEIKKAHEITKEVGLETHLYKLASELSGGQQQRVGLARVLMRREPILLLDEPFSGLDDTTRIEMLELVLRITKEHHLHTIMVTHDMDDADRIANSIYRMQDHRLGKQC
jgi:thiamine transport system ATP-binding protein